MDKSSQIYQILERACYAPSADNIQPWRFKMISDTSAEIWIVPSDEHPTLADHLALFESIGCLQETIAISASLFGLYAKFSALSDNAQPPYAGSVFLDLIPDSNVTPDPLSLFIEKRATARGPYKPAPISHDDLATLKKSVGSNYRLLVFEKNKRFDLLKLYWINNKIRAGWRGVFDHYKKIVVLKGSKYLPLDTLGLSLPTRLFFYAMLWNWNVYQCVLRYFGGKYFTFLEIDILPTIFSAGHVILISTTAPNRPDDYIAAGRAVQRFWLTAAALGIKHQPNFLPIAMVAHAKDNCIKEPTVRAWAAQQEEEIKNVIGQEITSPDQVIWLGRIGYGQSNFPRTSRQPLSALLLP